MEFDRKWPTEIYCIFAFLDVSFGGSIDEIFWDVLSLMILKQHVRDNENLAPILVSKLGAIYRLSDLRSVTSNLAPILLTHDIMN